MRIAYAMIKAMVCGYHTYKEIWCATNGECKHPKEDIVGVFDIFNMRWYHQLQSYRQQTLF